MFFTWNDRNDKFHRLVGKKCFPILTMLFKCGRNSAKKLIPLFFCINKGTNKIGKCMGTIGNSPAIMKHFINIIGLISTTVVAVRLCLILNN